MVYNFFDKKTRTGASINEELVQELQEAVIKKLKRRKVYARFKDNIGAAELAEMGSLSKNRGLKYLLSVADVFTKYAWFNLWKLKKLKQALMVLLK